MLLDRVRSGDGRSAYREILGPDGEGETSTPLSVELVEDPSPRAAPSAEALGRFERTPH